MHGTETIYTGTISARREDAGFLVELGITLGHYDEPAGEFRDCRVPESVLTEKLDEHWGRFVWSLEPERPEEVTPGERDREICPAGRTVILTKNGLIAALGLTPAAEETVVLRKLDPRLPNFHAEEHPTRLRAHRKLEESVRLSRRRGWEVVYDGVPLRDEPE